MAMGTQSLNLKFSSKHTSYCLQRTAEDMLVPPLWKELGKLKKKFFCYFKRLQAAQCVFSRCKLSIRWWKSARATIVSDLDIGSAHGQPAWCRARSTSLDDGLEDIRWVHGLGGESLPAVFYVLLPNLKLLYIYFLPRRIDISSVFCTPATNCFYITPGRTYHRPLCEHDDPRVGRRP